MDLGTLEEWGRLLAAFGAGGALGLRAELRGRPAGLRTHILVCVGAAVFCTTAGTALDGTISDPLRGLQGVASGIGLVAAATVLKRGAGVTGLTTAASVWLAAALGCEAAFGSPLRAFLLGCILALLSQLLHVAEVRWMGHGERDGEAP